MKILTLFSLLTPPAVQFPKAVNFTPERRTNAGQAPARDAQRRKEPRARRAAVGPLLAESLAG